MGTALFEVGQLVRFTDREVVASIAKEFSAWSDVLEEMLDKNDYFKITRIWEEYPKKTRYLFDVGGLSFPVTEKYIERKNKDLEGIEL